MTAVTLPAKEPPALPPAREIPDHADAEIAVPSHTLARRARGWMLWLVIIALLVWSWGPAEMSRAGSLFTDWRNMAEFGSAFLRPDFRDWGSYLADMIVTIQIGIWGPALAALPGEPFAILAYSNVPPQWIVRAGAASDGRQPAMNEDRFRAPVCRGRRARTVRRRHGTVRA
jgi:hypothetical protein